MNLKNQINHLTSMKLLDFRSHRSTNIELAAGVTLFCGQVGSGKSSIPLALSICLTGRNALTDGKGSGSREMIRLGADHWQVNANFSDGLGVIRTRNEKEQTLSVNLPNVPNKLVAQEAAILMKFGLSAETLAALLDVMPLCQRSRVEQKALLLKVLRPEVFQLDGEMLSLCSKYGFGAPSSIEDVQSVYDRSYKARAAAKKESASVFIPIQPEDCGPVPEPAEVQKRIQELRTQQMVLIKQIADAEAVIGQYEGLTGEKSQNCANPGTEQETAPPTEEQEQSAKEAVRLALEALKPVDDEIRRLEAQLKGKKEPDGPVPSLESSELAQVALAEAQGRTNAVYRRMEELAVQGVAIDMAIAVCRTEAAECPTCLQMVLPKHKERIEERASALLESFQSVKAEYATAKAKLSAAEEEHLQMLTKRLFADHAEAVVKANALAETEDKAKDQLESIQKARAAVKLLAKMEPKAAKSREELPALRENLEVVEKKLAKAQTILDDASRVTRELQEWQKANEAKRATAERVMDLEALVEYMSPSGIQTTMLASWIGPFLADATKRLALCGLGPLTISFEPFYLSIGGVQLEQASGGQRFLFETCWRLSVAELTSFGIAVLDDVNDLGEDTAALDAFIEMLKTAPDVQTIISRTTDDPEDAKALLAKIPGKAFFISTGADGAAQVKEV